MFADKNTVKQLHSPTSDHRYNNNMIMFNGFFDIDKS